VSTLATEQKCDSGPPKSIVFECEMTAHDGSQGSAQMAGLVRFRVRFHRLQVAPPISVIDCGACHFAESSDKWAYR